MTQTPSANQAASRSAARPSPRRLAALLKQVRACRACADLLPLGPRPVLRAHPRARVLIVGQAPGIRVHQTGVPWNDLSGDRLRDWLGVSRETFYDESRFAIIPMGYCYPGRGPRGDLPPRRECAELWLDRLLAELPCVELTLLVGQYAQAHYLGRRRKASLAATVRAFAEYLPRYFPLPHPSPRNIGWRLRHPWFERDVLPALRAAVRSAGIVPREPARPGRLAARPRRLPRGRQPPSSSRSSHAR